MLLCVGGDTCSVQSRNTHAPHAKSFITSRLRQQGRLSRPTCLLERTHRLAHRQQPAHAVLEHRPRVAAPHARR